MPPRSSLLTTQALVLATIQEQQDSPAFHFQRRETTCVRHFIIDVAEVDALILELFPDALLGYPYTARYPGIPWLYVESCDVKPLLSPEIPAVLGDVFPPSYPLYDVTVNYRSVNYDHNFQSQAPHANDGPGGNKGSTSNNSNATFLTHSVEFDSEVLTYPNHGLYWALTTDGVATSDANDPKAAVNTKLNAGRIVSKFTHTLTWNFVQQPPWAAVFSQLGTINTNWFSGCPAGTLLFLGCNANREYSTQGAPVWRLTYKFGYKNYNATDSIYDFRDISTNIAWGWNYFFRPNAGAGHPPFQRLLPKSGGDGTYGVYRDTDFSQLFIEPQAPPW